MDNLRVDIFYTGTKLLSSFNVKGQILFQQKKVLVYRSVVQQHIAMRTMLLTMLEDYRNVQRVITGSISWFNLLKYPVDTGHLPVNIDNFQVIGTRHCNVLLP